MNRQLLCIILFSGLLSLKGLSQSARSNTVTAPRMLYYLDSKEKNRTVIFKYDTNRDKNHGFGKNVKPTNLSSAELIKIERLINTRVTAYNKDHRNGYEIIKEPEKYFKQIIPVINSKGEKQVWVFCRCTVIKGYWRKSIGVVNDGGTCLFSLTINLTRKSILSFSANGLA